MKKKNAPGKNWGWKDPRTTLTIEAYLPYLIKPHFYACFRDPKDVAKSLEIRNNFPISKGIELAKIYNKRLFEFLKNQYLPEPLKII